MQAVHMTPVVFPRYASSADIALFGGASDEYRELEEQLAGWFFKLSIHEQWSKSRLHNSRASAGANVLRPLLTTANRIPHLFPPTLSDLRALDMALVLGLLQAYGQEIPPKIELDAARRIFARFVGAPVY